MKSTMDPGGRSGCPAQRFNLDYSFSADGARYYTPAGALDAVAGTLPRERLHFLLFDREPFSEQRSDLSPSCRGSVGETQGGEPRWDARGGRESSGAGVVLSKGSQDQSPRLVWQKYLEYVIIFNMGATWAL